MSGNHEDSITVGSHCDVGSIGSNLHISLRVNGMVTIYKHEVERTSSMDEHHRSSTSNQDSSRLVRIVFGMYGVLCTHTSRVLSHRSTLLMLTAMCVFVVTLSMVIYISLSLTD